MDIVARLLERILDRAAQPEPVLIAADRLHRETGSVLTSLLRHPDAAGIVTLNGVPQFLLLPIDGSELLAALVDNDESLAGDVEDAEADLRRGDVISAP